MDGGYTAETIPTRLRYRIVGIAALGIAVVSVFVPPGSESWALAVAVWIAVVGYANARLGQNRVPGAGKPRERIGAANAVTLVRGWLIALFAGIVTAPPSALAPVGLFVVAVVLDAVDGAIARRTRETVLGGRLDGAIDALTLLVGSAAAVALGSLPAWYLLAGGIWYGYSAALWFRKRAGRRVYDLPDSRLRPLIGSAQFLVVATALWSGGGSRPIAVAAAVALASLLVSFARDWAAATGRLRRDDRAAIAADD